MFSYFANHKDEKSVASQLRRQRFQVLLDTIESFPNTVTVLDIGGRPEFWETMLTGTSLMNRLQVTLINLEKHSSSHPNITALVGDAREMPEFNDKQFNIIFSNSTIEHVGSFNDQRRMADEVKRVGQKYVIQTPNRYFPVEPHFVFPLFQFLPLSLRAWLLQNFALGWYPKIPEWQQALDVAKEIRLLNKTEFKALFPEAKIFEEKIYGLVKSFMAYTA